METVKETIITAIQVATVFFVVGIMAYLFCFGMMSYSAHDFEKRTGLNVDCNAALDCFVENDGKWIPYGVWKLKQVEGEVNIKLKK